MNARHFASYGDAQVGSDCFAVDDLGGHDPVFAFHVDQTGERRHQARRIARNPNALLPRGCARHQRCLTWSDADRIGQQPAQRRVGLAVRWRRAHPRFEDRASIGAARHALDGVTAAARRQPHVDEHAARRRLPRQIRRRAHQVRSAERRGRTPRR